MYYVEQLKIEGRVYAGWTSHSAASSIYSQDDGWPSAESTPQISRQNSTATTSKSSTASKASTLYSLENTKSLGYTPFEYWKGPPPVPYPSQARITKKSSRPVPVPPRIKTTVPTPPPARAPPAARNDDEKNPFSDIHALVEFGSVPELSLRDIKMSLDRSPPLPPLPPLPQPPRSPRVKDRYAQREAERARRRALRRAQRARERALEEFAQEWPGWIPDENALLAYGRAYGGNGDGGGDGGRTAGAGAGAGARSSPSRRQGAAAERSWPRDEKRRRSAAAASVVFPPRARERWTDPRTWRRRVWGAVVLVVVVLVIVAIILGQLASKSNMLSMPSDTTAAAAAAGGGGNGNSNSNSNNSNNNNSNGIQRRLMTAAIHRVAETHGAEDSVVPAGSLTSASSASSSFVPPLRRRAARQFHGRAWAV